LPQNKTNGSNHHLILETRLILEVRLAVKTKPAALKTRSQAADEAKALLYSLAITSKFSEIWVKIGRL
jgi:hypothetical protein